MERITLHAARRWDRVEDQLHTTGLGGRVATTTTARILDSPQIGIRLGVTRTLELRANAARAERPPDFLELFGNQGSVAGNPALVPEHGENWDAGAAWSGGLASFHVTAEAAHFESRSRDLIVYVRNSPSSVKAQNISNARVRGAEFSLQLTAPAGLSLSASATRQSSVDQGDIPFWRGKQLPQRPEEQAFARIDWRNGPLRAGADVHYLGHNYLDRYNRDRVAARTLIGASLAFVPWLDGVLLTLEGKNLTDQRAHDVASFPLPGRSLFVSVQVRFGN
jgi:iron complex outermembrane receptor protein